ncbi:UNVERIFIED_CONTAM: hypothetical protein Cloal_1085 [Acetivibrio alkalicellulosi]
MINKKYKKWDRLLEYKIKRARVSKDTSLWENDITRPVIRFFARMVDTLIILTLYQTVIFNFLFGSN